MAIFGKMPPARCESFPKQSQTFLSFALGKMRRRFFALVLWTQIAEELRLSLSAGVNKRKIPPKNTLEACQTNLNPFLFLPDKYNRLMKRFCQFILPALFLSLAGQTVQAQQTLTIQGERVITLIVGDYLGVGVGGVDSFAFKVHPDLTDLDFSRFGLTSLTLPEGLENLETLNLAGQGDLYSYPYDNHLTTFSLPESLTNLKTLDISNNDLLSLVLPVDLTNLETLNLSGNNLHFLTLPEGLASLETLNLEENRLTSLTLSKGLMNLATLNLVGNRLKFLTIPEGLAKLETLDLSNHNLTSLDLPEGWANLKTLNLSGNGLSSLTLPAGLTNLTTLDLANNKLTSLTLPKGMTRLEGLTLDSENLTSLTQLDGTTNLKTLRLHVRGDNLTFLNLPTGLASLETLRISGSNLKSLALPEGLANLKTLNLWGTSLETLFVREDLHNSIQAGKVSLEGFEGTLTVYDPPVLNISRLGDGSLEITWNTGVLQSAADLFGEWRDLESATSPLRISFPKIEAMRFFRLRL